MAETLSLPEGWTVEDAPEGFSPEQYSAQQKSLDEAKALGLPEGWTVEDAPDVKRLDNEAPLREQAGVFAAPEKTAQDLKNMTLEEKLAFIEDINRERAYLHGPKHLAELGKGALSGATFGLTENIEALKPDESGLYGGSNVVGQVAGSLLPLHGLTKVFSGPALKLAESSPVFQKQLGSLATMFGVGATESGLRQLAKGDIPSVDEMVKHGAEWAAVDAGLSALGAAGQFAKGLLSKAKDTGASRLDILNDIAQNISKAGIDLNDAEAVGTKAMEVLKSYGAKEPIVRGIRATEKAIAKETGAAKQALEKRSVTPEELKTRNISKEAFENIETKGAVKPEIPQPTSFSQESESLAKDAVSELIEEVAEKAPSKGELGKAVKEDIEKKITQQKEAYGPLYNEVESAAKNLYHIPEKTADQARTKLFDIMRLKTKPSGYASVEKDLANILEDSGYIIMKDEAGNIDGIFQRSDVSIKQTMDLAKRIHEIIDYSAIEPSIKDALRSVVRAAKSDVRDALTKQAPDILAGFELAEEAHGKMAAKFRNKDIRRIRRLEDPDKIARMVETPNGFAKVKEVVSPETLRTVERELLDELTEKNYEQSKKMFREFEKHLSEDTRMLAKDIVESKSPHNPEIRRRLAQEGVLNDISNALTTGNRPEKTLDLWKTRKGQKLVESAFKDSPNWKNVKSYLEQQSFDDMVSAVSKGGKLDIKKFESFMSDPAAIENIRSLGGQEAVEFFQGMGKGVERLKRNEQLLQKIPKIELPTTEKGTYRIIEKTGKGQAEKAISNMRGSELLKKAGEAIAKQKRALPEKIHPMQKKNAERGKNLLEKTKRKTEARKEELKIKQEQEETRKAIEEAKKTPISNKVNKWIDFIEDTWGVKPKAALAFLGYTGFGVPGAIASGIGIKLMDKLITSKRLRNAFVEAAKGYSTPIPFVIALEKFAEITQDEI